MNPLFFIALCLLLLPACNKIPEGMVLIPAGEFILGTKPMEIMPRFLSERTSGQNTQPRQSFKLGAFYMDILEVTYGDFLKFKPKAKYDDARAGEPVRGVSWYEADAYCLGLNKRLPTEFEWEKAARGTDGRLYIWGNEFHRDWANLGKRVKVGGRVEKDKSAYEVYDMNGNVSEWTASFYKPYPGSKFRDEDYGEKFRVIRGGAINSNEHGFSKEFAMLPYRNFAPPTMRAMDTGFRCSKPVPSET